MPVAEKTGAGGRPIASRPSPLCTRDKCVNARSVQHLMGYLKTEIPDEDTPEAKHSKQELLGLIED